MRRCETGERALPGAMESLGDLILQFSDLVSTRKCALRIDASEDCRPLGYLLDQYVKRVPMDRLLQENRTTRNSADSLYALQDLLYLSSDGGHLLGMVPEVAFKEPGRRIGLDEIPTSHAALIGGQEVPVIDITIDRMNGTYHRNWTGFHARKWLRGEEKYSGFVLETLVDRFGPSEADQILEGASPESKLKLLEALSWRVWNAQFENYSRFSGKKLVYKSGDETVDNIIEGAGAICSEKVQALKFLTDHYGLKSEYILAGPNAAGPVPVEKLRELLVTFDFRFTKRYTRFWQHTALLYDIDGERVLVDATNGNIPFLALRDPLVERLLGYEDKLPVSVKMVEAEEDFYYHRVPQDIPENFFFALEGWMPFTDLMQVFDNELGLYLSSDYYVIPIPFRSEQDFTRARQEYEAVSRRAGLDCSVTGQWGLDSLLGTQFSLAEPVASQRILEAEEHLLARLNECEGTGHQAGLVIMKLGS